MPTLLRNGQVHAPGHPGASALLVENGRIGWIGDEDAAAGLTVPAADVIDLAGDLLAPAFVDSHVHTTETGLAVTGLDLREARTLAEALDAVERAARHCGGRPVLGGGWNDADWPEGRAPTAAELDRASYGGVVYLARVDIHSAVVSSALMAAVPGLPGLDGYRADGWMREPAAHDAVRQAANAALTRGQRRDAQQAALRRAAALGIASVHEMAGPVISGVDDLADLLAVSRAEVVPEVVGYWGELGAVATARELGAVGAAGDLFCDGSLGSGTAALGDEYADRPGRGWLRFDVDEVAAHVRACLDAGLQAGFHAIGDAAVDQVIAAYEQLGAAAGRPVGAGHRMEHAEFVRDPARLAATGLTVSMQPLFDALWGGAGGLYAERLGESRALVLNRFGDLHRAGVPLAFGSDSPVTPLGPWEAIRAAVHPHEAAAAVSPEVAFAAHTVAGWRAAGRTGEGVLAVGAPATFAQWAGAVPGAEGLPDLRPGRPLPVCRRTVLRGREIHAG